MLLLNLALKIRDGHLINSNASQMELVSIRTDGLYSIILPDWSTCLRWVGCHCHDAKRHASLVQTYTLKMHPYSRLVLSLVVSLLCGGTAGIWPFNTFASANLQSADQDVKQVAIIGTLRISICAFRFRLNTPSSSIDDLACDGSI
jgi:hypothetical protein